MNCPRDGAKLRQGVYMAQTVNKPRRNDGMPYSVYPCGPGVLRACLKCPRCGYSEVRA